MIDKYLKDANVILASKSPRRQELLKNLGVTFEVKTKEVEEVFPEHLVKEQIAIYLAQLKAEAFKDLKKNDLLITSDTIVWQKNKQFGKPKTKEEAVEMLTNFSNNTHQVITAVHLRSLNKRISFYDETDVVFNRLSKEEINYYVDNYKPFDKAGAYGIQEWIGQIGISQIKGSYYNVMGLPTKKLYNELIKF